jgi:hypothetical protein
VDCRAVGSSGRPIPGEVGAVDGTALRWAQDEATETARQPHGALMLSVPLGWLKFDRAAGRNACRKSCMA